MRYKMFVDNYKNLSTYRCLRKYVSKVASRLLLSINESARRHV